MATEKKPKCLAAIDIGSNAVRLMIKKVNDSELDPDKRLAKTLLLRVPLRLGSDVFRFGRVSEETLVKFRKLMKSFKHLMSVYDVTNFRACATSAMRDANNGSAIIAKVLKDTNIRIEIIDGKEEARMIYNSNVEGMLDQAATHLFVDEGGGSTEINLMKQGKLLQSQSYNIGTVRILSQAVKPETWQKLGTDLKTMCTDLDNICIVGSGGNINKLFKIAAEKDEKAMRLPVRALRELYNDLKSLSIEQRMKKYDLKPERADVIVPAAEIFLSIADITAAKNIIVPFIGLGDGIINSLYAQT